MNRDPYDIYVQGIIDGLAAYAWWKDGTQYVGTTGTTLAAATEKAKRGELWNMIPRDVFVRLQEVRE